MAPTVDDIVEILGNIQAQDNKNNDSLKSYFDDLKNVVDEKQSITAQRLETLENNFNELLSKPTSNSQELHDLFQDFQRHANEIFEGISSQQSLLDHFNKIIEQLATNKTDKDDVLKNVNDLKDQINESSEAFSATNQYAINSIQTLTASINELILKGDSDEIKNQLINLVNSSNNMLNTLKEFNQKSDKLAEAIKNLINSDEYVKAWQKIYAISDMTSEISARMSYLPLKSDTDALNQKIDTVKEDISNTVIQNSTEKFEKINNIISDMAKDLIEQQRTLYSESKNSDGENPDDLKNISEGIKKLEDAFNLNAQNYKSIIYDTLTQIKNALDDQKDELTGLMNNANVSTIANINEKLINLEALSSGFKTSLEDVLSGVQSANQNLASINCADKNAEVIQEINNAKAVSNTILDTLNNFIQKNDEFEKAINNLVTNDSYDLSLQKIDTLCSLGEELASKIDQLPSRTEITDILTDISQNVNKLSSDFVNQNNEYQNKIEDINNNLQSYFEEIKNLTNNNDDNALKEQLSAIENALGQQAKEQKEKIEKFKVEVKKYADLVNDISNNNSGKLDTSVSEISEIKTELQDISDIISTININTDYKFSESVNYLDENIQKIISALEEMKSAVSDTGNISNIQNSLNSINEKFDENTGLLKALKKSSTGKTLDTIADLDDKLAALKQEIDLVNTDVLNSLTDKFENIIKNIEGLKNDISEIIGYDFDKNFADLKSQIELSYLNVSSDIKNMSNSEPDSPSNIEHIYGELQSQLNVIDETLKGNLSENIELLKVTMDNLSKNIEVNLNKTTEFANNMSGNFEELKDMTTDVKTSISKKLDAYTSDIKNHITNSDSTDKVLSALDNFHEDIDSKVSDILKGQAGMNFESQEKFKNEVETCLTESQSSLNDLTENVDNAIEILGNTDEKIDDIANTVKNLGASNEKLDNVGNKLDNITDTISTINDVKNTFGALDYKLDNIENAVSTIDEVNDKVDDIDNAVKSLDDVNDKLDNIGVVVNSLDNVNEVLDNVHFGIGNVSDKLDGIISSDDKIANTLNVLHSKVDVLAQDDDFDISFELEDVKNLILEQIEELKTTTEDEKTKKLDACLNDVLVNINNIDKNSKDVKDSIISAIVSVFDQVSFVEETEEIKDFVEEKTEEINHRLKEVNERLQLMTSGGNEVYTYTLQDVESDIAKLRLAMNDINDSSSLNALEELKGNIDRVVDAVENMKSSLSDDQISSLKNDFTKLSEDMVSISSRTNKLLLTSDDSYRALSDGLEKFSSLIYQLENKIDFPDTTAISERIEKKVDVLNAGLTKSISNDQIFHKVFQYVGEWMDSASENINGISQKTNEIDDMKETLDELKLLIPEKAKTIDEISHKFEKQELRIDKLEMKLDSILTKLDDNSDIIISKKLEKLDKQISNLSMNVEKITSYVDED